MRPSTIDHRPSTIASCLLPLLVLILALSGCPQSKNCPLVMPGDAAGDTDASGTAVTDGCKATSWCVENYGSGVHCQLRTGRCVPDESPDHPRCEILDDCADVEGTVCHVWGDTGGRCAPACDNDYSCVALSPNLLCSADTGLCYQAEPLRCSIDAECAWMGSDYRCTADNRCKLLAEPELGCIDDNDCSLEPEVKVCHLLAEAGTCAPPCVKTDDCGALGADLMCDTYTGHCVQGQVCGEFKSLCGSGELCHWSVNGGTCMPPCAKDTFCKSVAPALLCDESSGTCFYPENDYHTVMLWVANLPQPKPGFEFWIFALTLDPPAVIPVSSLEPSGDGAWVAKNGATVTSPDKGDAAKFKVAQKISGADYIVLAELKKTNPDLNEQAIRVAAPIEYFEENAFWGIGQGFFSVPDQIWWPPVQGAHGTFGFATPTDNPPDLGPGDLDWENETQGIWFVGIDDMIGTEPTPGLYGLPMLNQQHIFEGWVVDQAGDEEHFYSLGRFRNPDKADSDKAGPNAGEFPAWERPGSDFIVPGKALADTDNQILVTIEKASDNDGFPSEWIVFHAGLAEAQGMFLTGEVYELDNVSEEFMPRIEGWLEP